MTTSEQIDPATTHREQHALAIYGDEPMEDGDVLLLLDETVCLEVAGLADHWRVDRAAGVLAALHAAERVVLGVARPHGRLRRDDLELAAVLRAGLAARGAELAAVVALRGQ